MPSRVKEMCVNKVKLSRSTLKSSLSTIPIPPSMTTHTTTTRGARARAYLHSTTLGDLSASTGDAQYKIDGTLLCRFQINRTTEYITRSRRSLSVQLPGNKTLCSHSIPPATLTPPSSTFVMLRQLRSVTPNRGNVLS